MNIAIVTREVSELTKNGGIGTAMRYLCEYLTLCGKHKIAIYYTGRPDIAMTLFSRKMQKRGINFYPIISWFGLLLRDQVKRAWRTYELLSKTEHDIYLFHDFMADSFYCMQSKMQGISFTERPLGIITHGSSLWVDEGNRYMAENGKRRHLYEMEQVCCEQADFLVSPSRYLLDWMRERGWRLPERSFCIPNFTSMPGSLPSWSARKLPRLDCDSLREIVFFGRLETRKGIRIFCDALLSLPVGLLSGRCITFLGKEADFRVRDIRDTLAPLEQCGIKIVFLTNYNTLEARRYLCGNGILAIMPSLRENSPCTVSECLEHRVPFLASSVGGGKELVHEEDRAFAIFDPRPSCLAERLRDILGGQGIIAARASQASDDLLQQWQNLLQRFAPSVANGWTSKFFRS